jgi:methionyl-tRNA formyltransferase
VQQVHNFVRGLSPYPAAHTTLGDRNIKIYTSEARAAEHTTPPGTHDTDHSTYLRIATPDGWLYITELQQEGKKRMGIVEFLRGFRG